MISLPLLLACAKVPPAPALITDAPVALTGEPVRVDHVEDHRYLHYAVGRTIDAPPDVVWGVLTDASSYTKWNSTVVSLDGQIAAGEL